MIVFTISAIALFFGCIAIYQERQVNNLKSSLELTKQELQETRDDRDYYKSQYQKYYELSEELQNQLGVYCE
ncbi:hypothetical protein DWX42_05250 [Thomasclavelia ramosa]|nr:hypothetical protein DWX42_05250 [Thomasclavelia ramosa]